MDRTLLDCRKEEEKDLSSNLYNKLRILSQIHKPSHDFLKVLSDDMFLKPNTKAFFQVMRYLFELLDPVEFKKRFYWPLCDKKSETFFRSSTVQYLNYLNDKHNLKWSQLKNYLVVMPGGMRFISFLLEFVEFVVTELTKRKERELSDFVGAKNKKDYESLNLRNVKKAQEVYIKKCVAYAEKIESATELLKKSSDIFEKKMEAIGKHTNIPLVRLKDPNFIKEWEASNWKLFRKESAKREQFEQLNSSLTDLKQKIEDLLNGETEKIFNFGRLQDSYNLIKTICPDLCEQPLFQESELNYDAAIKAFNHILLVVQKQHNEIQQNDFRKLEFESAEMETLRNDFVQLEADMAKVLRSCPRKASEGDAQTPNREGKDVLDSSLKHKFINTPPIKFDIDHTRVVKPHLPLLDDFMANEETFSFTNDTTLLPRGKPFRKDFPSTSKKGSRIIDAQTLLRTVRKQNHTKKDERGNISVLASKWREREKMFADIEANNQSVRPKLGITPPAIRVTKDNGTFNSECSTIKQSNSPEIIVYPRKNLNSSVEFDLTKVGTSPSGRLECLIKPNSNDIPKLMLNDESIVEGV